MAYGTTSPSPSLRQTLRNGNIFGGNTQSNLSGAMNSTWANLRSGSFGTPPAQPQAQEEAAPAAPPAAPLATPPMNPGNLPGGIFATPGTTPASVAAAGGLAVAQQQGDMAAFQDMLRLGGVNLNPIGQSPGDFHANMKRGVAMFNNSPTFKDAADAAGGPAKAGSPGSFTGLPFGTPVSTYAPTDLRQQALAANGGTVTGFGGTQVTGTPGSGDGGMNPAGGSGWIQPGGLPLYKQTGARFTLKQNPNTVPGAPGYVPAPAASAAPASPAAPSTAATQTALQKNTAAYLASQGGATVTAPNGDMFVRDPSGRLQAAGNNPALAAKAAGQKSGAEAEERTAVESARKEIDAVHKTAESSRVQLAQINRIDQLYKQGATSGVGQEFFTNMGGVLSRLTGENIKVSNQQELDKHLGKFVLDQASALSGQGQISDSERKAIQEASANRTLTPQANMAILGVFKQIANRNLKLEAERIRLDDLGMDSRQIAKEIRRMQEDSPLDFSTLANDSTKPAASAAETDLETRLNKYPPK